MNNPFAGKSFLSFTKNKKTYFGAALLVAAGVAQAFGYHIPEWVFFVIGGGTIAAHRQSISNLASAIDDIGGMLTYNAVVNQAPPPFVPQPTALEKVQGVVNQPGWRVLTEEQQTALLNQSQLHLPINKE